MKTTNEHQDDTCNSAYNPFPEPQTIPAGWDMSELIAAPASDSEMDERFSAES